ncbi:4Fe-4S dicluster domain-containing protein [Bdellovibrionota bacterium FG-1]
MADSTRTNKSKQQLKPEDRLQKKVEVMLENPVDRRAMLKSMVSAGAMGAAIAAVPTKAAEAMSFEQFFQKHYLEMTPEDKKRVFARIVREEEKEYGVKIDLIDPPVIPGVKFGYFLNLLKCNGSRRCVEACRKENNLDSTNDNIRVLEMGTGTFNLEKSTLYYTGEIPKKGKFYMPVQCHQCDNPPCVKVCPVTATWKEPDGIVVIDYDWCIGCRYCQAACPYEARSFNFRKPDVTKERLNPRQAYLSNRVRMKGVMEKCTFCLHRSRNGQFPACMEACPTGARKFGNLMDPQSEVARIFREKKLFILKEELNTVPRFFYYFE